MDNISDCFFIHDYDFISESGIRFSTFKSVGIAEETGPCLFAVPNNIECWHTV